MSYFSLPSAHTFLEMHQRLMRKCNVFLCSMKFFNYLNFNEFLWQSTNCNTCFIRPVNRNSVLNCQLCFQVQFVVKACAVCCRVICLFHQLWNFQTVHVCLFFQLHYHFFLQESNLLSWIFEKVVIVMVAYFLLSILNSMAQKYHKRLCKSQHKKNIH